MARRWPGSSAAMKSLAASTTGASDGPGLCRNKLGTTVPSVLMPTNGAAVADCAR
jgi:hypothetical protein